MKIICIGEVLWDLFDDGTEFLGGAPLNVAFHSHQLGNPGLLLSAVGQDSYGSRILNEMRHLGLSTECVYENPEAATGTATVFSDGAGFEIRRPAAFDFLTLAGGILDRLQAFRPEWLYFGTLAQTLPHTSATLEKIIKTFPAARCFYDVNLRTGHWNLELVQRLCQLATAVKLNESEARTLHALTSKDAPFQLESFCHTWREIHGIELIAITRGSEGCALYSDGSLGVYPGFPVNVSDTVGAGDAFVAALIHGVSAGWTLDATAVFSNALAAVVASRAGATPDWTMSDCNELIESQYQQGR